MVHQNFQSLLRGTGLYSTNPVICDFRCFLRSYELVPLQETACFLGLGSTRPLCLSIFLASTPSTGDELHSTGSTVIYPSGVPYSFKLLTRLTAVTIASFEDTHFHITSMVDIFLALLTSSLSSNRAPAGGSSTFHCPDTTFVQDEEAR